MKKNRIIYWATTGIISAMMLFSAFGYFTNAEMKMAFVHLGFPNYFRIELGVLKILGAVVLILPNFSERIKSFAYFGFTLTFISAFIAHAITGDPISVAIMPLIFLLILIASFHYQKKISVKQ